MTMQNATKNKIYLASPHMSDEGYEMQYIKEAFDTNWIAPLGKNVNEFENEFAAKVGIKAAAALISGTSAIHMALKAAGVGEGDIVFCQSLTFSATANPIIYQNATPVFIDSDYKTWNMDPKALEEAFEKYPNVKAVLVVHLYGLSADMDKIVELCNKHNVVLIEDAAESLGTYYKGKHTGTFGDYGIFSFNGNKIITTSGGGMLVSDNEERIAKVRFWATQSRDQARHYQHSELGFNYRMSNIVAGIGRGQLKVLDQRVEKKKYIFEFYKRELGQLEGVEFMPINKWNEPNYWLSCMTLREQVRPLDIIEALEKENIESRPIWKPMHMQPVFEGYDFIGEGVSEKIFESGVCLPSDTKMTDEDLNRVCNVIKGLWAQEAYKEIASTTEVKPNTKLSFQQGVLYRRYFKRTLDFILSLIVLLILSPLLIIVAILIKVGSDGPIFFTQERPGKNKRIFKVYKFRTMVKDAVKQQKVGVEVTGNDARITPFGKFLRRFKIDELAQLINILKGDMSIVGPRPTLPEYIEQYEDWELKRFNVRPGLTGLAQINGNIYLERQEKSAYDVKYVENISFLNDIKIILKTVAIVFLGEDKFINKTDFKM